MVYGNGAANTIATVAPLLPSPASHGGSRPTSSRRSKRADSGRAVRLFTAVPRTSMAVLFAPVLMLQ
ncbi:hypothetical protein ACFQ07_20415, partial [Actinomadura adrarensis]